MTQPFQVFASPLLDRFEAYEDSGRFVLRNHDVVGTNSGVLFTLDTDEAADLIDALQKFIAVNQ